MKSIYAIWEGLYILKSATLTSFVSHRIHPLCWVFFSVHLPSAWLTQLVCDWPVVYEQGRAERERGGLSISPSASLTLHPQWEKSSIHEKKESVHSWKLHKSNVPWGEGKDARKPRWRWSVHWDDGTSMSEAEWTGPCSPQTSHTGRFIPSTRPRRQDDDFDQTTLSDDCS